MKGYSFDELVKLAEAAVKRDGDTMTGNLTTPKVLVSGAQGTEVNALTRRDYVTAELAKKLNLTGGTLTGNLTAPAVLVSSAQDTSANALTRKDYVDGVFMPKSGGSFTGNVKYTSSIPIIFENDAPQILKKQSVSGVRKWYIGEANAAGDLALYNDVHGSGIVCRSGFVETIGIHQASGFTSTVPQGTREGDMTRKDYVDSAIATGDALQVSKTGDTMTGNLTTPKVLVSGAQGTEVNALTRRDYVTAELAKKLNLTGGTLTGNLTAPAVLVSSAQDTSANALTRKDYVDSAIAAGDAALREDLASSAAGKGVSLVFGAAKQSDLTAIDARVDVLEQIQGDENRTAAQVADMLASGATPSISAFGDSCMFGADVTNLANQNPINPPNQLTLALTFLYNLNVPVANRAISGSTLRQLMSGSSPYAMTFEQMISAGGPDEKALVIYCNHGINDSAQNLSIDQYRLDLVEFVRLCREKGKVPILVTPNPNFRMAGGITETQSKRLVNFVNVMRSVAEKLGCDLVDQNRYFSDSFNVFKPTELFPDGIHMSTDAYRQAGFNLAIPLICVNKIGRPGDVAGFSGTTYFDNLTNTRQMQTQPSRTGKILSGNFPASGNEGVNFPVVFDVGQTVVSYIGLQFFDAANCNMYCNGVPAGHHYLQRRFGLQSASDWDAEAKSYGKRMAGLNVFGLLFNRTAPGSGAGMTFGGIALPTVVASSFTHASDDASPYKTDFAATGDAIFTTTSLPADVNLRLDDKTGTQVLTVEILSGVMTVKLYNNGAVVQTGKAGSDLAQKEYGVKVALRENQVVVTLDYITVTLALSHPLPMIRVATPLKAYTIKPINAI